MRLNALASQTLYCFNQWCDGHYDKPGKMGTARTAERRKAECVLFYASNAEQAEMPNARNVECPVSNAWNAYCLFRTECRMLEACDNRTFSLCYGWCVNVGAMFRRVGDSEPNF